MQLYQSDDKEPFALGKIHADIGNNMYFLIDILKLIISIFTNLSFICKA